MTWTICKSQNSAWGASRPNQKRVVIGDEAFFTAQAFVYKVHFFLRPELRTFSKDWSAGCKAAIVDAREWWTIESGLKSSAPTETKLETSGKP